MALQVWLPLNGNLYNQGLSDLTVTSTTINASENGIIGKCMSGYTDYFNVFEMAGKKQISVAYWIRLNTAIATDGLDTFRWYSTDGDNEYCGSNELSTNDTLTRLLFQNEIISGTSITVGKWYHFIFTIDYENGKAIFYINGSVVGTSLNVETTHYLTGHNFMIGENGLDASYNDFRIYDHILSAKEVNELSKGLIIHYPFNDSILNLNDNIIYDVSGYNNNGIINGVLNSNNSSPRYSCSFEFDGSSYIRADSITSNAMSASLWIYVSTLGTNSVVFGDYKSKLAFGFYNNKIVVAVTGDSNYRTIYDKSLITTDVWHHIVIVKGLSSGVDLWIDCEKQIPMSGTDAWNSGMSDGLIFGSRTNGTAGFYVGSISDFRLYFVQLTSDDIKELYNTSASIDNKGNVYAHWLKEL